MLTVAFGIILKMNIIASFVSLIVLAIKFILQKIGFPVRVTQLLWIIIAFRLICPVSVSSEFSLFNFVLKDVTNSQSIAETVRDNGNKLNAEIVLSDNALSIKDNAADNSCDINKLMGIIWMSGTGLMLIFGMLSYLTLKKRLRFSTKYRDNIYIAENISIPFVLGFFKPKIYIPNKICKDDLSCVTEHEMMHIKKGDNILKLIGYIILAVHWFNPLNHIIFKIFSLDLELLCDEYVTKHMCLKDKMHYVNTILKYVADNKYGNTLICGIGFSHHSTKLRIKKIMNNRFGHRIMFPIGIIVLIAVFVVTGTNKVISVNSKADNNITEFSQEKIYDDSNGISSKACHTKDTEVQPVKKHIVQVNNKAKVYYEKAATGEKDDYIIEENSETDNLSQPNDIIYDDIKVKAEGEYKDGSGEASYGISSDENGEMKLHFDINTETLVGVTIINSETKEKETSFTMLAGVKDAYTVSDLDVTQQYDIEIKGITDEWNIEGEYYIY